MPANAGQPAPPFALKAAVSGRAVGPQEDAALVLVFHGPRTTDAPKSVGKAVRAAHPDPKSVLVANIVDLRSMAGAWRRVAEAGLRSNYEKMAGKVAAAGGDPVDLVVICPDWDGAVCRAFGIEEANVRPGVAVVRGGRVVGVATSGDLARQALDWLA